MGTVLTYHVVDEPIAGDPHAVYVTSVATLRAQFRWLRESGRAVVDLAAHVAALRGERLEQSSRVVVTLDDGIACCYERFLPVVQDLGLPATVFVVAGRLGGHNDWETAPGSRRRRMITAAELRALSQAGVQIGSHGMTHRHLSALDANSLRTEVRDSKARLEDLIGHRVAFFAYPYGDHSAAVRNAVREAGYAAAVTSDIGIDGPGADLFALRRTGVHNGDGTNRFKTKVRLGGPIVPALKRRLKDALGRP